MTDAPDPFAPDAVAPETAAFNADLAKVLAKVPRPMDVPVALTRAARAKGQGVVPLHGPLDSARWEECAGPGGPVQLRITDPKGAEPRGTYLHIHGGGWTFGSPEQYDILNRDIAEATGARVVAVKYRLSPEARWPAALEDSLAAAEWALAASPGPLVIGGESAGAHLSACLLLALRDAGRLGPVTGAALSYGIYDLALTPSAALWGERYMILSTPVIRWFVENLIGDGTPGPESASPLRADLRGLVPAHFMVGTEDALLDDTMFMEARWRAAGNPATLDVVPGGIHAFDVFELAIAGAALNRKNRFIAECLSR